MNVIGFSKSEREIHRHNIHLQRILWHIFQTTDKLTITLTGSKSEDICGSVYFNHGHHDFDFLLTNRNIKLYTPRTNNINPPLLLLHDNKEYDASCFVEEDDKFPGYVKLSLAEVKTDCVYLDHCKRMNDDKLYLSNSVILDSFCEPLIKLSKDDYISFFLPTRY